MTATGRGLILAAPCSGSGKTTLTLGLLRALQDRGQLVRGAKSGPDYIDPRFHEAASGQPCPNLDAWAMSADRLRHLSAGPGLLLIEGAMGLFDGAPPEGRGATADLARHLGLPVILIVDARAMSQSIAPLVAGFARHDPAVAVAGVILNRVGSPRHEAMLRRALAPVGLPVLGAIPRQAEIALPSRHLGLVQASERNDLDQFLATAAGLVTDHIDLERLKDLAAPLPAPVPGAAQPSLTGLIAAPPAQTIAIAQDRAFAFAYPHLLADWRRSGAEIRPFSPLADAPVPDADLIYLPGGYPELHAGRIAASSHFLPSLRKSAEAGLPIYGECGGYMVLGDGLTDAHGQRHPMAGLLSLETSFAERRLHLGYRRLHSQAGPVQGTWFGHEFHYATTTKADGAPLFDAWDAEGTPLAAMGLRDGNVSGSFAHLIDVAAPGLP